MKKFTILIMALLLGLCVCIAPATATDAPTYEAYVAVEIDGVLGYFTETGEFLLLDPDNPYIPDATTNGSTGDGTEPEGDEGGWADPGH